MALLLHICIVSVCSFGFTGVHGQCSFVCGEGNYTSVEYFESYLSRQEYLINATLPPTSAENQTLCSEKERQWAQRAQVLLRTLGIKSSGSNCTTYATWNWAKMSRNTYEEALLFLKLLPSFRFREQHHQFDKCYMTSIAGFFDGIPVRKNFEGSLIFRSAQTQEATIPDSLRWNEYDVFDTIEKKIRSFRLPSDMTDFCNDFHRCELHQKLKIQFVDKTNPPTGPNVYGALLADYNLSDFGAHEQAVSELLNREDGTSAVREDVSISNLAILSLPLLMSLPPISLYDVSDNTVLWWVFATDIMAALPLLIKGIELVVSVSSERTNVHANTRIWDARPVTFFETYFVHCDQVQNDTFGTALILIAVWLIVASCFCEYLFWRRSRLMSEVETSDTERRVIARDTQDNEYHLPSFESDGRQSWLRDGVQFLKSELWNGRHKWISLVAMSYLALGPVSDWFLYGKYEVFMQDLILVINLITTLTLFVLHLCASQSELQPFLWVGGVFLGPVGPLYIIVTRFTRLRYSEKWHHVTKGANLGCALIFGLLLDLALLSRFPPWPCSSGIYCICVLIVHTVRCKNINWSQWRVCALSFSSGIVFGPLFIVFKDCFPEIASDKKFERRVRFASWAGLLMFLALVLLTVGISTGHIPAILIRA